MPVFSFDIVSYGAGLTKMSLKAFALATLVGMAAPTFAFTYLGSAVVTMQWPFIFAGGLSAGRLIGQSLRNENGKTFTVPPLQKMDYNLLAEIDFVPLNNLSIFARSFNSMFPIRRWGPISLRFNYGWYNIVMVLGVKYQFNAK